jgi:hypothetical protein
LKIRFKIADRPYRNRNSLLFNSNSLAARHCRDLAESAMYQILTGQICAEPAFIKEFVENRTVLVFLAAALISKSKQACKISSNSGFRAIEDLL